MKKALGLILAFLAAFGLLAWSVRSEIRAFMERKQKEGLPSPVAYIPPIYQATTTTTSTPILNLSGHGEVTTTIPGTVIMATSSEEAVTTTTVSETTSTPAEINLAVPFMLQAPKQDWSMPYQEACEEASMLMVKGYYLGRTAAYGPDEADKLILDFIAYEAKLGLGPDLNAAQTKVMLNSYLGLDHVDVIDNPTITQIKQLLAQKIPVIMPASGKLLHNPNFRNGGPTYHMLVLKGYTKDGLVITNDPGTHNGPDYVYSESVIMNAMHDWNGGDVEHGTPRIIVVRP